MTDIVLSQGQQEALDMIGLLRAQKEHILGRITGYAGTGKTTLIGPLADQYGEPTIVTPTGKAALRVGEATGIFAQTLHRFLYEPKEDPKTGQPVFQLKPYWDETFAELEDGLVLVDEASMVPPDVCADLLLVARKVGFHVVTMGDLFQLPPVHKSKDGIPFSMLAVPTPFSVNLTEVHRQALGSPIIKASMLLRSGKPEFEALALLNPLGASTLIESVTACREAGGATICFTNERRHDINNKVRAALGYQDGELRDGEPLLVTQNNYNLNVYNGEVIDFQGWTNSPLEDDERVVTDRYSGSSVKMRFGVTCYNDCEATLSPEEVAGRAENAKVGTWIVRKAARFWYRDSFDSEGAPPHLNANFGYALTCHKAQGSEWPEVLVVLDEALGRLRGIEKKRWLYTAITRAAKRTNYIYIA